MILLAVVYHSTSCEADANRVLLQHLLSNVESFLRQHLEGLIMITLTPTITGFSPSDTCRMTGLRPIAVVLTRDTGILDWCLTNRSDLFDSPKQLPKLGSSDYYTILIAPAVSSLLVKNVNKTTLKGDPRPRGWGNSGHELQNRVGNLCLISHLSRTNIKYLLTYLVQL